MSGLNQVTLLGRLGRDPELKDAKGTAICKFSLATSEEWKDEGGEKKQETDWHEIVCFRKTAEIASKYLAKGRQVLVVGKIKTRSWDDEKTGTKKYRTYIIANNIQFVGDNKTATTETSSAPSVDTHDEIPF